MDFTSTTQDNETSGDITPDFTGDFDHVTLTNPLDGSTTFRTPDGLPDNCIWAMTFTLSSGVGWGETAFVSFDPSVYKSGGSAGGGNGLTITRCFLRIAGVNFPI
jgi:hypothetical protein